MELWRNNLWHARRDILEHIAAAGDAGGKSAESSGCQPAATSNALGPAISSHPEDETITEVTLNPDGRLWIDRLSNGLIDAGEILSAADGERIVRLIAHRPEVHAGAPRVSAELPGTAEHFEGLLPLVVAAPAFAIACTHAKVAICFILMSSGTDSLLACLKSPATILQN